MTTAAAKPPRPMKLNRSKAELVPADRFQVWYDQAVLTPGLTRTELAILDAIAGYYRRLQADGNASSPTIEMMAESARVRPIDITTAIRHLVSLCLVGVKPGAGARRNEYMLALPKRVAAAMSAVAVEDGPQF
jgi:hypothetical protein